MKSKQLKAHQIIQNNLKAQRESGAEPKKLLPLFTANNPKILKSLKKGFVTIGLSLAPEELNGIVNFCESATPQCIKGCINKSGRGAMDLAQRARIRKSTELINDPISFFYQLINEIGKHKRKADRDGYQLVIRLNVYSDIRWEEIIIDQGLNIFEIFPDLTFYDYTKHDLESRKIPSNYDLTFSYTGYNRKKAERALSLGKRIAVVFNHKRISMPESFLSAPALSGDDHDLTFIHPQGIALMLTVKGSAVKEDNSPFILGSYPNGGSYGSAL